MNQLIEYDTEIPDDKVANLKQSGLFKFTKLLIKSAIKSDIAGRFHTIEAHNLDEHDRIYLRNTKPSKNCCYLFIDAEIDDNPYVGFGELQHSGGEPTWDEAYYDVTEVDADNVIEQIKEILK